MIWLTVALVIICICFCGVLLFGAPYLPTLGPQVRVALELADLKPGQTMLELGCGDGKILIAAAKAGIHITGYELNPILALVAWLRTRRYRAQVSVVCANFWSRKLPVSDVIYIFLLQKYMKKLDTKITQEITKPVKIISFAFAFPERTPVIERNGLKVYDFQPVKQ